MTSSIKSFLSINFHHPVNCIGDENKIKYNLKPNNTLNFLGIGLVMIFLIGSTPISFADYNSPKAQLEAGIAVDDIQCRDDRILVLRTNGSPACVTENAAEKIGWEILSTEFDIVSNETDNKILEEPLDTQNVKQELMFAITSDIEYDGKLYGYHNSPHIRQPVPSKVSTFFGADHYDVKQAVQDSTALLASKQINFNSLLDQLVTSSSVHENAIDYRQWLPTKIPDGFELKWIDITQPEVRGDDIGRMKLAYFPNTADISGDMMSNVVSEFPVIGIGIAVYPFNDDPFPQSRIDFATKNGTSTQVFVEEKYGGILVTIVASPSNPSSKYIKLFTNEYMLEVAAKGIPLEEVEKIFLEILELQ